MYAALTELEQWLAAASNWLTGAALVISLPLAAVYIGCMVEARREDSAAQTERKDGTTRNRAKSSRSCSSSCKQTRSSRSSPV